MGIEYELKFSADAAILSAIADEYGKYPTQHFQMATTYYDTPSGALSALHYTLRQRMENNVSVCTLKTPASTYGRKELEVNCDTIQAAIPLLCQMGAPEAFADRVQEGILPVCSAKFHRIAITLVMEDCVLELALDTGTLSGGSKTIPLCEVEVELKSGDTSTADQFAAMLMNQYGLVQESRSKFRRALALYKGECL